MSLPNGKEREFMNKQRMLRVLLQISPRNKMLHKEYNRIKLQYHRGYYLPADRVAAAEKDPAVKKLLLEEYADKWKKVAEEAKKEADEIFARAPAYHGRPDKRQLWEDMLFCRFAYGFKPDEYVAYALEKKTPEERKAYVSSRDLLCMIYQVNDRVDFEVYNDKARTYERFRPYYKREAICISAPQDFEKFHAYVAAHPAFVKKNVHEAMGRSVEYIDTAEKGLTERELFDGLIAQGKCLLEERVIQSRPSAALNPSSVNTIRCITYYTRHGVIVPYCFMKVGRAGSFVDNGGAGGILVGIDSKTGRLNTDGFDEFITRYEKHPDSGIPFRGYQLPEFEQAVELSKKLSAMTPTVKFVGWDFAHTEQGWVVIEGNGMSQLIGPQIVWERGVKAEMEATLKEMDLLTD